MAQDKPDPANYYLSIAGDASFWALRINDVTVWRDFQGRDTNLTVPVNFWLRQGQNDIDLTFVTVKGSPIEYNVANSDFYFLSSLQRVDLVTRDRLTATMLNLGLDVAENRVTFPDVTKFGQPVEIRSSAPMKVGRDRQDSAELSDGWGKEWQGRRVTAQFEIADALPTPPWHSAPVIEDTPEMREKLLDAYRSLHTVLQSGDRTQIQAKYQAAWQHLAVTMNYNSVEEYIEKVSPFQDLAPVDGQGKSLQPLDLVLGPRDFQIERMAGGRLIRIIPDPIIWSAAQDPNNVKSTNVAFFMGPDNTLRVGAVLY